MVQCACGQRFGSEQALAQHQLDKARNGAGCGNGPAPVAKRVRNTRWREAWIWKNVRDRNTPVQTIHYNGLEASSTPVTSTAASELVCTYNWQERGEANIFVPGHLPKWQDIPLPVTIQKDKGSYFVDQNTARVPKYPFEPIFQASAMMSPNFRFDDVDIVVNRNSLRKLLEFCKGRVPDTFMVKLLTVNDTLFIERCERSARELIRGSGGGGWGHNFEQFFTKSPAGADGGSGHHRVLCYPLGHLRCAVRFEVDACYDADDQGDVHTGSLLPRMGALSLSSSTDEKLWSAKQATSTSQGIVVPQSTAAELKTSRTPKSPSKFLPQLWFGRTPWLIVGNHTEGTFHSVKITDAEELFPQWETQHQAELRKMVTVLDLLREAVKKAGGKNCVAVCEKSSDPRVIKVFRSIETRRALPEDLIAQFWVSSSSEN